MNKFKRVEVPLSDIELIELEWIAKSKFRSVETLIHGIVKRYLQTKDKVYTEQYTRNIFKNVLNAAAHVYGVDANDVMSRTRSRVYAEARHMTFYIIRTRYKVKFEDIGNDSKFHYSTIIHAVKTIENLIQVDQGVKMRYEDCVYYLE